MKDSGDGPADDGGEEKRWVGGVEGRRAVIERGVSSRGPRQQWDVRVRGKGEKCSRLQARCSDPCSGRNEHARRMITLLDRD